MATRIQVTIDCADPNRLARFWAETLGYRLASGPGIWFQPVPEGKVVKDRVHLDLAVGGGREVPLALRRPRVDAEADRLEGNERRSRCR